MGRKARWVGASCPRRTGADSTAPQAHNVLEITLADPHAKPADDTIAAGFASPRYNLTGSFFRSHPAARHRGEHDSQSASPRLVRRDMPAKHHYIIGKSGTGKSTLLEHLLLTTTGGFCLLDPHGDLAEAVADKTECIYFDPIETPMGLNVLGNVAAGQRHLVAANVIASFKAIWSDSWGPRLEWILYNSLRLLLDNNESILAIPKLLTVKSYRASLLARATFPDFWLQEFDAWDTRYRNDAIAPVLNKVGQLVADPVLQKIMARKTTLKPSRIFRKQQRLVVNLSKAKLGATVSALLGSFIVTAFYQAALTRDERPPFRLVADEFQNFATDSFADILSESRKYGLFITAAHQLLGQLPPLLRQSVFGNVGEMICFRVGAEDAPLLAKELGLKNPDMLTDLSNFEAYSREGGPYDATLFKTLPPTPKLGKLEANKRRTRARH